MKKSRLELFELIFFQLMIISRFLAAHENPISLRKSLVWPAKSGDSGGTSFFFQSQQQLIIATPATAEKSGKFTFSFSFQ